ncbi:mannosyltransferase YkcB-related protein [Heyndrickxia faecalis]
MGRCNGKCASPATYQLATDQPVMDIGGFTGSDPAPTLSAFKKYVRQGKIHYFIMEEAPLAI